MYRTTDLFQKLFGLPGLSVLPDVAACDPTPEDEGDIRERLLRAGEARLGVPAAAAPAEGREADEQRSEVADGGQDDEPEPAPVIPLAPGG